MSEFLPVNIAKSESRELIIEWDDGVIQQIPFRVLRDGCQCATCMDKKMKPKEKQSGAPASLPILSAAEARPLDVLKMRPVGNYAYNIQFSDGHNTGIFTFDLLRSFTN